MSVKQGYQFEREIVASGQGLGMHIRKIPTSIFGDHKVQGTYDVFVVNKGDFLALELKEIAKQESFPLNRVEPHQVNDLVEAHLAGGRSFVIINYRVGRNLTVYAIPIYEWINLETVLGRKSIPFSKITEYTMLPDVRAELGVKEPRWDLRVLYKFPYRRRVSVKRVAPPTPSSTGGRDGGAGTTRNGRTRRRSNRSTGEDSENNSSMGNC